jgi:hypothetical protein
MESDIATKLQELETKIDSINATVLKIRRVQRNASITRIAYWSFIILLSVGALWFLKPLFNHIGDAYGFDINSLSR